MIFQREKRDDILWIFLHVPKTAGSTFGYHLKNTKSLCPDKLVFNKIQRGAPFSSFIPLIKPAVKAFPKKQNIDVLYGHCIPRDLDSLFEKEKRYVMFIRHPVERTISLYNFLVTLHNRGELYVDKQLLVNGKVPPLKLWIQKNFSNNVGFMNQTMFQFLSELGYISNHHKSLKENIEKALDKFYFIGTTETFTEDSLYLYGKLKLWRFYKNRNISRKYYSSNLSQKELKIIIEANKEDFLLYKIVQKKNQGFKRNQKDFYHVVKRTRIKRLIFFPLTNSVDIILEFLYKFSARMKKKSNLYTQLVYELKRESFFNLKQIRFKK